MAVELHQSQQLVHSQQQSQPSQQSAAQQQHELMPLRFEPFLPLPDAASASTSGATSGPAGVENRNGATNAPATEPRNIRFNPRLMHSRYDVASVAHCGNNRATGNTEAKTNGD